MAPGHALTPKGTLIRDSGHAGAGYVVKALHPTAIPLRSIAAGELGRDVLLRIGIVR